MDRSSNRSTHSLTNKHHVIDDSSYTSRLTRHKFSEPRFGAHEDLETSLGNKEKRLDEQFKTLLDRCNRSKEYIENIHKSTFLDRKLDSMTFLSPTASSINKTSPFVSRETSGHKTLRDFNSGEPRSSNKPSEFQSTFQSTKNTKQCDDEDYGKLESEIVDLKNTIIDKIKSEEKQARKSKAENTSSSQDSDEDYMIPPKSSSKLGALQTPKILSHHKSNLSTVSMKKAFEGDDDPTHREEKFEVEKNIDVLKSTLKEREKLIQEKYENAKLKNKELKVVLREYVNKVIDLEESLKKKDALLAQYEEQSKKDQAELNRQAEFIEELRKREELMIRNEEETRSINNEYKQRLAEQRARLDELEEAFEESEARNKELIAKLTEENNELKTRNGILKEREALLKEKSETLQNEIQSIRGDLTLRENNLYKLEERDSEVKRLNQLVENLNNEKKHIKEKNEELKKQVEELQRKLEKKKKKIEEETRKITEQKDKEIAQKKEKIQALKAKIDGFEAVANKALEEQKLKQSEVERLLAQKKELEREVGKLKEDVNFATTQM